MQILVLAAGMGSRFGGLKQMEPMDDAGNFLIDFSIYDAKRAGFDSVVFVIKHSFEKEFKETIGKRVEKLMKVEYAFQDLDDLPEGFTVPEGREKPWGTGHAILAARDVIREDFIMINGDDFYGLDAYKVAANYIKSLANGSTGKYANVAFKVSNTMTENGSVKRGVCFEDNDHNLTKMVESSIQRNEKDEIVCTPLEGGGDFTVGEETPVSMNLFIFNKDIMPKLQEKFAVWMRSHGTELKSEFLIPTVVDELVHEGKATLKLLSTDSVWFGVTYKEDKPSVVKAINELVEKGVYKKGLY